MKKFVNGRSIFLVSLILTVILFYSLSHSFFLTNYLKIEQIQNTKHINNLLTHINTQINQLQKVANTFAYNGFNITSVNKIQNLGLEFILYEDVKESSSYSLYNYHTKEMSSIVKQTKAFEEALFSKFNSMVDSQDIFVYKKKIFYLVKKRISANTSLYLGKLLTLQTLKTLSEDFEQLYINDQKVDSSTMKLSSNFIQNIHVNTELTKSQIINQIGFYDKNKLHLFSLETINQRNFVNEGEKTIHIVNIIMALFLAIIMYIIYKSQIVFRRMLQKDKKSLEIKVERRTKQLEQLLKKLKTSNEQLHYLAYSDPLTKTHNRRSFFIESEKVLKKALKKEQVVSLVMIDIDNFKQINDKYGHNIGDKVLVAFTAMIKDEIGKADIFGRLGGEEFAIVFPNTPLEKANEKVETLRTIVSNLQINLSKGEYIKFTASFGLNDNQVASTIDDILKGADELLYSAKESGKNVVRSRINHVAPYCDLY